MKHRAQVLGDETKRADYDKYGNAVDYPDGSPFDAEQIFRNFEQVFGSSFATQSNQQQKTGARHGPNVTV